jgi:glutamate racemase
MKIGVFDSGVGGLAVANAILEAMPEYEIILKQDKAHVPYGNKTTDEVFTLVVPILEELVQAGCKVIVIACNTVSTNLLKELKKRFSIPLVGIEPMVKPASQLTKTNVIAVFATPLTLTSERYGWLKETYAEDVKVIEPDCSDWSYMIEHDQIDHKKIKQRIDEALEREADVIVLGCTHYHWIEEDIRKLCLNRASVIQPEQVVIKHLWRELQRLP